MSSRADGFHLPVRFKPGVRCDEYLCPICKHPQPRYQLREDVGNIPRRVDVAGMVCDECLQRIEEESTP